MRGRYTGRFDSLLPFLEKDDGKNVAGNDDPKPSSDDVGTPGGKQGGTDDGAQGDPVISFPTEAAFMQRVQREANRVIKEQLGVDLSAAKQSLTEYQQRQEAEKTELQRAQDAQLHAEQLAQQAQTQAQQAAIEAAAVREASKLDIRSDRLDAMLRLADFSGVNVEQGKVDDKAISDVLTDLVSQFPEWKRQAQNISSGANTGTPNGMAAEIADLEKRLDESRNRGERAGIMRRLHELTRS